MNTRTVGGKRGAGRRARWLAAGLALAGLLSACGERPPVESVQRGFRGVGMVQVYNPRFVAEQLDRNQVPEQALPLQPDDEGPRARDIYQNVQVLGHLSAGNFIRHMTAITAWVSPQQGCAYCHVGNNFAADDLYTKVVARRMIQMTQHINQNWKTHVANTGVTCWTCHRGRNVPAALWFSAPVVTGRGLLGHDGGQNKPSEPANLSTLPYDPFTPYLLDDHPIRVQGNAALPNGNRQSIKQTEWTYSLMTHMSTSLGVNCTYCHNSRSWRSWEQSPPQRATAWHGIRMVREVNNDYLVPLTGNFPPYRLGVTGDVAKVNCATCHQGAYKPLYGQSMLGAHPELARVSTPGEPGFDGGAPITAADAAAIEAASQRTPQAYVPPTGAPAGTLVR